MSAIDRRGRLDEEVFTYRESKDGLVFIHWHGKLVVTLRDHGAKRFLARIAGLDGKAVQLEMARITGNFKHGNER